MSQHKATNEPGLSGQERMFRGARLRSKRPDGPASPVTRSLDHELTVGGTAYVLARANQHKSWARRWLKQNGHWI